VPGSQTGIGRFVGNLLTALSLEPDAPELFLYANQRTVFEPPAPSSPPLRAKIRRRPERAAWWWDRVTLPRMARHDRLDVFLSPYFKAPGVRSCPVAITVHDLLFLRLPPRLTGRSGLYRRAFRSFAAAFARRAAVVLTVSKCSRNDIVELLGVPRGRTRLVGNCVGPHLRPVEDPEQLAAARRTYGIDGEYALYVGNFGPHKNVQGLLGAYAGLDPEVRERFRLVLAGAPDKWRPDVERAAAALGLEGRVLFPGHVAEEHLPAVYSAARAFVTLSWWEGFGLPAVEAMACGTPVLCSNRGALPEVVGDAALVVEPDAPKACSVALAKILTDDAFRSGLRTRGLARAQHFAPERFAKKVLAALEAARERS